MPTTTKLVEHLPRRLVQIAKRIEQRRRELNLTQQALADRCTRTRKELFGPDELGLVPKMTRERIAKILMVRNHLRRGSAAKALYPHELQLLAHTGRGSRPERAARRRPSPLLQEAMDKLLRRRGRLTSSIRQTRQ